jgi:uncharacterized protein
MADLLSAIGLVLVIEGALYALFPEAVKRMMVLMSGQPSALLRAAGVGAAAVGVIVVWLVRG